MGWGKGWKEGLTQAVQGRGRLREGSLEKDPSFWKRKVDCRVTQSKRHLRKDRNPRGWRGRPDLGSSSGRLRGGMRGLWGDQPVRRR